MKNYRVIIGCTLLLFATSVFAQYQTGNIYGKVVTTGGGGLPGVTVTLAGIGSPQTFITESDGSFRFLNLSPGSYNVRAELEGLGVAVKTGVQVNIGNNTNISLPLTPKTSESITITATAPLVDTRETKTGATITNE